MGHPGVRIIVSSDWQRLFDDDKLTRLLGPTLGPRFMGVVESRGASRADEIYAEVSRRGLTTWLAIDDHPTVAAASKHDKRFVVCAADTGLSDPEVQRELREKLERFLNQAP